MRIFQRNYRISILFFLLTLIIVIGFNQLVVASTTVKIPIYSFHEIVDETPLSTNTSSPRRSSGPEYTNTKQDLEKFLDYLARNKYWFLSTQELYDYFLTKSKPLPFNSLFKKPIMLTFDDGYKGVHTNLFPVLKSLKEKYRTTAKLVWFVNPVSLGVPKTNNSLAHVSCDELREGLEKGFYDVQSHGFSHLPLTKIDAKSLTFELTEAQVSLRKCTQGLDSNKPVGSHIAYPYGMSDARVEEYTSKYYLTGYSYENKVLEVENFKNKYQIPRLNIIKETSLAKMIQLAESSSRLRRTIR